jgi:DNA-directed RNA polymerase subunit RPC12/RpoP
MEGYNCEECGEELDNNFRDKYGVHYHCHGCGFIKAHVYIRNK